ncbi:hypothetical protein [Microbispora sp. ATCC PTA-5024]|uniref:hypothetical protein n=1 Tax=Microbispora sp. ATCC PTA-5024 TaxID=316330 RepID=UPI0003DBEECD|nr:hypothetical protein [Microbispora sp. ATCC PTA-5024]ETK33334.1 hypothetical protein MPTA5024_25075 [Microbispora sp. ATCC PTA-5024]
MAVLMTVLAAGCAPGPSQGYRPPPAGATVSAVPAPTGATGGSTPGPATPAPARTGRPSFPFPRDFRVVVATSGAPAKAAGAVRTFGEFWRAWWYAVTTAGRDERYLQYIVPGTEDYGTGLFARVVGEWRAEGVRPVGVVRAHDVRVVAADAGGVTLAGCGDETRAGTKNLTTGRVSWTFGQHDTSRYKIRIMMAPGQAGGWRVRAYQSVPVTSPAGRECR